MRSLNVSGSFHAEWSDYHAEDKGQRFQKNRVPKSQVLTCRHRRRVDDAEVVDEPVVAPVPPVAVPVEVTNVEVAVSEAVDSSPEEDVTGVPVFILFPHLGNEVRVLHEMVQQIGVQNRLVIQFCPKDVACDDASLLFARQPKLDFLAIEIEVVALAFELGNFAFLVFFHAPAVRQEGVGTEVNGMFDGLDFGTAEEGIEDLPEEVAFAQLLDLFVVPTVATECLSHFVCLACRHCEHVTHSNLFLSVLWTCSFNEPVRTVGLERCAFATVENGLWISRFLLWQAS